MVTGQDSKAPAAHPPPLPDIPVNDAGKWQESLRKCVPAIVVIRVCSCSAFDGESPGYSHATGFVVDKARGIILTNRHVVTPGAAPDPQGLISFS